MQLGDQAQYVATAQHFASYYESVVHMQLVAIRMLKIFGLPTMI